MNSTYKELLKKIYSEQDIYDAAVDFYDFWNNHKKTAFEEVVCDRIKEHLKITIPKKDKLHNEKVLYFILYTGTDYRIYWDGYNQLGFTSMEGKKFDENRQKELQGRNW